jgi:hypothetical protein
MSLLDRETFATAPKFGTNSVVLPFSTSSFPFPRGTLGATTFT